jgi:glucose/arabinose dehydrogenase
MSHNVLYRSGAILGLAIALMVACPVIGATNLYVTQLATGLERPLQIASAPHDARWLYVAEQRSGKIQIIDTLDGSVRPTPFLQLPTSFLGTGPEQGLLGMAFDPDYANNGLFYVNYVTPTRQTVVERYRVSATDPYQLELSSAETVLRFQRPGGFHNGGWLQFSPTDGYLYISSGDGGGANDNGSGHTPGIGNAQDLNNNFMGKILRIDPDSDQFPDDPLRNYAIPETNPFANTAESREIWAYGLRNPWRNSFDRLTGDLYIADVGEQSREEVNFQSGSSPGGENYGWRLREGTIQNPSEVGGPAPPGAIDPIHDYPHTGAPDGGFSVTGGYVYRGGGIPQLEGHYLFTDFISEQVWSFEYANGSLRDFQNRTRQVVTTAGRIERVSSFGEDANGTLYATSLSSGAIYRFDAIVEGNDLVSFGSTWKYDDRGVAPESQWNTVGFSDQAWESGAAPLGYNDSHIVTTVDYGGNADQKNATTFLRRSFPIDDTRLIDSLSLGLMVDDGAAVYLNGVEVLRTSNLAPGATHTTFANYLNAPAVEGPNERSISGFLIDPKLLINGLNVVAVEVHQHAPNSSDMTFDLRLAANALTQVGDFDLDSAFTAADAAMLCEEIARESQGNMYDLDENGVVDRNDLTYWIESIAETFEGDLNLDGRVDALDLAAIQANLFNAETTWLSGDLNCDGMTDTSDFHIWLANRGQMRPAGSQVVPEPSALFAASLLVAMVVMTRRKAVGVIPGP